MSERTKFQAFEARDIHRTSIKNAPYNPRRIKESAAKALKKNLKERGLMTTLVWNERTGNLVSGHQRLKQLDALEKTDDYMLTVAVVNLDDKTEKEQNIFFNSTSAQGTFDFDALLDILPDINAFDAGFTEHDLSVIGFEYEAQQFLTDEANDVKNDINALYGDDDEDEGNTQPYDYEARKQAVMAQKEKTKQTAQERVDEGETYVMLSFNSFNDKRAFMRRFGLDENKTYFNGAEFAQKIRQYE